MAQGMFYILSNIQSTMTKTTQESTSADRTSTYERSLVQEIESNARKNASSVRLVQSLNNNYPETKTLLQNKVLYIGC